MKHFHRGIISIIKNDPFQSFRFKRSGRHSDVYLLVKSRFHGNLNPCAWCAVIFPSQEAAEARTQLPTLHLVGCLMELIPVAGQESPGVHRVPGQYSEARRIGLCQRAYNKVQGRTRPINLVSGL